VILSSHGKTRTPSISELRDEMDTYMDIGRILTRKAFSWFSYSYMCCLRKHRATVIGLKGKFESSRIPGSARFPRTVSIVLILSEVASTRLDIEAALIGAAVGLPRIDVQIAEKGERIAGKKVNAGPRRLIITTLVLGDMP
jgi:hypothetical protein